MSKKVEETNKSKAQMEQSEKTNGVQFSFVTTGVNFKKAFSLAFDIGMHLRYKRLGKNSLYTKVTVKSTVENALIFMHKFSTLLENDLEILDFSNSFRYKKVNLNKNELNPFVIPE